MFGNTRYPEQSFRDGLDAPRDWRKAFCIALCLVIFVGILLRVASPYPAKPYGLIVTPSTIEAIDDAFDAGEGWKLSLPYAYFKGDEKNYARYGWAPSSIIPLYFLEKLLPPLAVYLSLALTMTAVVFLFAYGASGSFAFAGLVSVLLSLGTHLHYNFTMGNTNLFYLVYCYAALHAYASVPWLKGKQICGKDWVLLFLSLALLFFSSDHWIAYACGVIAAMLVLMLVSLKHKNMALFRGGRTVFGSIFCFLALYVVVRSLYAGEHVAPGTEEELIFTYKQGVLMLDDFFNNFFTFLYMTLSTFVPPIPYLDGSQSLLSLDKSVILAGQNGYHPQYTELVWNSHVFMWRYAAGAFATCFFVYAWRKMRASWSALSMRNIVPLLLCVAICSSFSFYLLIKMRPYNSLPALGYKTALGVFFFSLLLSYGIALLKERLPRRKFTLLYACCIAVVVFTFLTKPFMLSRWLAAEGLAGMWRSSLTDFVVKLWQAF